MVNARKLAENLTVIIPAYNESGCVAQTIRSVQNQSTPPKVIIVIDDESIDNTSEVAKSCGDITVLRPPKNQGSKAGAQNYAMSFVNTRYTMAIDADTTLAPDAIEKIMPAICEKNVAAACGSVIPRYRKTMWERGRYIEYLFAFTYYKQIQNYYGKPLISSGCFSVYKTAILKKMGGWSTRTMAEDMDLTWSLYEKKYRVKFVPEAVSYPIEPDSFKFMRKQLKRWSHGFIQNVKLHFKGISEIDYLRTLVSVGMWDAIVASFAYLFLIPAFAIAYKNPLFVLGYFIDLPAVLVPPVIAGYRRKELGLVLTSIPSFFVLRIVNCTFILRAFFNEVVLNKRLAIYEKGH